jgi:hypothetical protein
MSLIKLDRLISEFPDQERSVHQLAEFFEAKQDDREVKEFTVQRMFDVASPVQQSVLIEILHRFAEQGVVDECVRVESDAHGGIGDFDSLDQIPAVINDWRLGRQIEVTIDKVRLIYKLRPKSLVRT